ncbi:conserved hypothetical protein [Ricinus communis]|uniref:Uncharacterized protein n=1 Tax=Ricinus communis TaxID=3988 RepID=B9RU87_RICCO|nr:conserved hypothetical protein [Ricinus communis]
MEHLKVVIPPPNMPYNPSQYYTKRFITVSCGYKMVYFLALSYTIFYQGIQVIRQMGHTQGVLSDVLGNTKGRRADCTTWFKATVWQKEKASRYALLTQIRPTHIPKEEKSEEKTQDEENKDLSPHRKIAT